MRAAVYSRVSVDDEREGRSVGEQEAECRDAAKRHSWEISDGAAFVDNDRSASRFARKTRPGFAELLSYLDRGRADVLVLWESSRGSRKLSEWAALLDLLRERGILVHVVTHRRTYDPAQGRDWKTLAEDGVDSEYESSKTHERIMRAVRANAMNGKPHGKLSYGYARRYDERGRFIDQYVVEEQAAVLREMARRVLDGEPCRSIAMDLNARDVPSPGGRLWSLMEVRRLLINPGYAGKRVHRGQVVADAVWPAILSDDTHAALVARLTDPRRRTVRDPCVKHLLTGTALCGVCGSPMRVQKNRSHYAYTCDRSFCVSVKTTNLEGFVSAVVVDRLSRPDAAAIFAPRDNGEAAEAGREAHALRVRLDGFAVEAAAGRVSPGMLAKIEADIMPKIEAAERRARPVALPPALRELGCGIDVAERWERLTVAARREVVQVLMVVRVRKTYRGARTFDPDRVVIEWKTE